MKNMNKTISVVVPCYAYAHFLGECVESIVTQSHKPDEIILVSDGAIDLSVEVAKELIKKYPDFNIKLVEKKNGGLSSARNAGIAIATSTFIQCLDSDDLMRPDAIKEHLAIADDKSVAQCGIMYFGSKTGTFRPKGATLESLLKTNTVYCNAVFPKQAWIDVGGYDESLTMRLGLEDWEFWIRVAKAGYSFKTSDYIGLLYRQHGNNMTGATTHPNFALLTSYIMDKNNPK